MYIHWEFLPRVTFETLNNSSTCHWPIRMNAGCSSEAALETPAASANCCWVLGGGVWRGAGWQGREGTHPGAVFLSMDTCQYFHNWHGSTVSACIISLLNCYRCSGLYNLVSQTMITGPAAAAPERSLKTQIAGLHSRPPESESAFPQDSQVINGTLHFGKHWLMPRGNDPGEQVFTEKKTYTCFC